MKTPARKPQGTTGRESDKFILRLPPGMRDKIAALAATNGRSMNSEIVAALEKHVEEDTSLSELYEFVEALQAQMKEQQRKVERLEDAVRSITPL